MKEMPNSVQVSQYFRITLVLLFRKEIRITSYNVCYTKLLRLNIGMNDKMHARLVESHGAPAANALYLRFIQAYSVHVARLDPDAFETLSAPTEASVKAALKAGGDVTVTAHSGRGTQTKDNFSLMGFTAAMDEAAKRCK